MTLNPSQRSGLRVAVLGVLAVTILIAVVVASGASPVEAALKLWDSAFGNALKTSSTLKETTPLLIGGLAVFIALKAGLFNIGVEGQIAIGALCAAVAALRFHGAIGIAIAFLAGIIGGAAWALPAGLIKAYRNGHEVISTIMLNNIASGLTLALVAGPLKDPGQEGTTTRDLNASSHVPNIVDFGQWEISSMLPVAILVVILFGIWLKRTVGGFELRLVGENPKAAEFAGVDLRATYWKSMAFSGGIAGFAGAVQVLAFEHRFFHGISSGYGFDALGVALLAGQSPLGMLGSGLLFGILNKGSSSLQMLGIPKGITWIVLALLIIVFAAARYRKAAEQ